MLLIRPKSVDSNMLLSSSILASEANWASTTIYATGDLVTVTAGSLDLNFATGSYLANGSSYALTGLPGYSYTRSGAVSYYNTTNATDTIDDFAANVAPVVSNGIGYEAHGSLTNPLLQSQNFGTTWGGGSSTTITTNTTVAPDGTTAADTISDGTTLDFHRVSQTYTNLAAGAFSTSVFAKAGTGRYLQIIDDHVAGASSFCNFDLVAGTVGSSSGLTGYIFSCGNGWYRCIAVGTAASVTSANIFVLIVPASTSGRAPNYTGANNTIILWQAQTLVGSFTDGGPLIPTTTAAAVNGSPTFSLNLTDGTYNVVYTFDDNSTQTIGATVSGGTGLTLGTYPSTLNRATVKRVQATSTGVSSSSHRVYESQSGGTPHTVTASIASPCVVGWTAHGLAANTPILFQTSGALPTGLTAGTIYYVLAPLTNSFNVSATAGGAAINTTDMQSGVHTATANPNKGYDPTLVASAAFWLDIGPTNRWAMFDSYNGTTTTDPTVIDVTVALTGRIDSVALLNIVNAASARVIVSTTLDGTIFDQTYSLTSADGIADWYDYFFEEVVYTRKLLVTPLPINANPTVRVIITGTGTSLVQCGSLVIGLSKDLGRTLYDGAQVGIADYSRKDVDAFGNYTIVQRAFSDRASFKIRMAKASVDGVKDLLSDYRAIPAVYVGATEYGSTMILGFFRDFNIEIDYPLESLCSLDLEGLT